MRIFCLMGKFVVLSSCIACIICAIQSMMSKSQKDIIETLRRRRERLLRHLSELPFLIRGSFFQRFSACSRPNCACHRGQRHGPRPYVAVMKNKLQKQYYVPERQLNSVLEGIKQYHHLLKIVDRITEINLQLMREGVLAHLPQLWGF